jgi:nucleotide-binding universal stress UspA family protein
MFTKILFPTDFSGYAKKTLECIAGFPGVKEVVLLHIIEETRSPRGGGEIGTALFQEGKQDLREEKHHLESLAAGIRVTTIVRTSSDTAWAIAKTADEEGASLIVIGARGRGVLEGISLGSVSHAVLRRSRVSVLIMRHKVVEGLSGKTYEMFCPRILSRVLCPVDFSRYSGLAVSLLGGTPGVGEVILLHVVAHGESTEEIDERAREATARLQVMGEWLTCKGIKVRRIVRKGDPAGEIPKAADEVEASLIWISSYGRGWFQEMLVGSTARNVAMAAKQPIIVIRSPEGSPPQEWRLAA